MKQDHFLSLSEEGFHKIAYTEWGTANNTNTPIICVHGLTRNSRDFDYLADYLSYRGAHVFCPDIVGRGDSDWLKSPLHYTYEQYLIDMTNMITRTNASKVDWIGTSMGGLIGMILAAQEKTPIRRLILNDVGPQIPLKALQNIAKYAGHDPLFDSIADARRYYQAVHAEFGNLTNEQWQHMAETSTYEISPGKFASKIDQGIKISPAKSKFAWNLILNPHKALEGTLFDIDLWQIWRKVRCPVLVIRGKDSKLLTPAILQKMQQTHPHLSTLEIANAGHAPALVNADEHETIYQWLMKTENPLKM